MFKSRYCMKVLKEDLANVMDLISRFSTSQSIEITRINDKDYMLYLSFNKREWKRICGVLNGNDSFRRVIHAKI